MKFLLTAKHWQIFLMVLVVLLLAEVKFEQSQNLTLISNLTGTLIYFLWPVMVGHELQHYLPARVELNYTFFMINGFLIVLAIVGGTILAGGETWHLEGLAALPVFYLLFAIVYVFSFPGRTIRSIESGRTASMGDSMGDFFLTFFLPLGIWLLQPRLNKIVEERHDINGTTSMRELPQKTI